MYESSVMQPDDKLNWTCRVRDILFKYVFFIISGYLSMLSMYICLCVNLSIEWRITLLVSLLNVIYTDIFLTIMFYNFILIIRLIICISHIFVKCIYQCIILILKLEDLDGHERVCSICNLNVVEDEYHHILQCEKYIDVRRNSIGYCCNVLN
jgi:hypothetical protein